MKMFHSRTILIAGYSSSKLNWLYVPFRSQLQFRLQTNNDTRQMVFSSILSMRQRFNQAENRKLEEAARILLKHITDDFEVSKSSEIPWPSSVEYLKEAKESIPSGLMEFLALVIISNRLSSKCSYEVLKTCTSFAVDIGSACTKGRC
jgi:hypothetical protein